MNLLSKAVRVNRKVSYLVVLAAIVPLGFMVVRLCLEERFLRGELPGYSGYALRVPHRLIPGVW